MENKEELKKMLLGDIEKLPIGEVKSKNKDYNEFWNSLLPEIKAFTISKIYQKINDL